MTINELEPKLLWQHFHQISLIPHPSRHEEKLRAFLKNWAESRKLQTIVDGVGNLIIKKPATSGYENHRGVVLQAHIDMVPKKADDKVHDFTKDPLQLIVDGEWLHADRTTLGADNGIGAAAALAILESDNLKHSALEVVLTIEEEVGLTGAKGLQPGSIDGEILLNLDSEEDSELFIGCAGGIDGVAKFAFKKIPVPTDAVACKLVVSNLQGGHSGLDIHRGRANSNKLMARFLRFAMKNTNCSLASINGGELRNAIPDKTTAILVFDGAKEDCLLSAVKKFETIFKNEYAVVEPKLSFTVEPELAPETCMDNDTTISLINALYACPHGVVRMSDDLPGLVETSNNLAIIRTLPDYVSVECLLRSSVESAKEYLLETVASVFELADAEITFSGDYPGWKPNPNSAILEVMKKVCERKNGALPHVTAIHAGLECGIIGGIFPQLDMISFGPTIQGAHSPKERVHIEAVARFWDILIETLENVPLKATV